MKTLVCGRWNRHSSLYEETKNLYKVRNRYDRKETTYSKIIEAENATIILLLRELEKYNVDIIGDGCFGQDSIFDITRYIRGCGSFEQLTRIPATNHFHRQAVATFPLSRWYYPILLHDFNFVRQHTKKPLAVCFPGPYSAARQTQLKKEIKGLNTKTIAYAYAEIFKEEIADLLRAGAELVRIEEPQILTHPDDFGLFKDLMISLTENIDISRLALATWFGDITFFPDYFRLPFGLFHLDFIYGKKSLKVLNKFPSDACLIAGIFDACHTYHESEEELHQLLGEIISHIPKEKIILSANTDFHFLPWDKSLKKVEHLVEFAGTAERIKKNNSATHYFFNQEFKDRKKFTAKKVSLKPLNLLPRIPFPTSTVGSFPQPDAIRKVRAVLKKGGISEEDYRVIVNRHMRAWMDFQQEIGITIPVSGEFFREDMAAYFGVRFRGRLLDFVPSYENRRYRPVEYYSKIRSSGPITVDDFLYVQSLTEHTLKETVTGPATLADWALIADPSYYHDRRSFRMDLARALRIEIEYLLKAGVKILQIDEPALTTKMENFFMDLEAIYEVIKGLDDKVYLILHICYSDMEALDQAFPHILKLPFQQIHMEMANRNYAMFDLIEKYGFGEKDIGLGVIDVHMDRIETVEEIITGVKRSLGYFKPEQIWLTPDCGLKERSDTVAKEKLKIMAAAAEMCRKDLVKL